MNENLIKTKAFALRLKDKENLKSSSSGGAFTAISDIFLKSGGAVVSAVYNYETNQNELKLYTTKEERNMARGSKYMQAYPLDSFVNAEQWVKGTGRELLFVGTGCQADGFRKFSESKGFRNKVTIVDIICHGVPSPKLWKEFINCKVDYLTFKDKRNGWKNPSAYVIVDGKEKSISEFISIFYNKCALRPSCHGCPYSTTERKVDLTIGDFWGIEKVMPDFYSSEGNSLLLIHTQKGKRLFEKAKDKVEWRESNIRDCLQSNLIHPTERSRRRDEFWRDYHLKGIDYVIKKYTGASFMSKFKHKIKQIFGGVQTNTSLYLWGAAVC